MSFNQFRIQLNSFIRYLKLTSNLDARFPNASAEEILAAGNCLICREHMQQGKKIACGHVFHLDCLRMWLQHQQTCPLCRAEIPVNPVAVGPAARVPVAYAVPQQRAAQGVGLRFGPAAQAAGINDVLPATGQDTMDPTGASEGDDGFSSLPGFFTVENPTGILLRSEPRITGAHLRTIAQGTVVFATRRDVADDGSTWLELPDGWAMERTSGRPGAHAMLAPYDPLWENSSDRTPRNKILELKATTSRKLSVDVEVLGSAVYSTQMLLNARESLEVANLWQSK
eukprot:gene682-757_t